MDYSKVAQNSYVLTKDLSMTYRDKKSTYRVLNNLDLSLSKGQIGVIIGPSGCGKSTLLHILAGLIKDYEGQVTINGIEPFKSKETSLILQNHGLLPWKTIYENIKLGLEIRNLPSKYTKETVYDIAKMLDITHLFERYPSQVSGGQRQRVALARALAMKSELLLMDEPFSALDAITREEMQELTLKIWSETKKTVLIVTHSIEEAVFLGQRIFVMTPKQGNFSTKIDNNFAGDETLRGKKEFYEQCYKLRAYLRGSYEDNIIS